MHRRRGGVAGIYHCEIPDSMNVTQTIYIGVYSAGSSKSMLCSFQPYCSACILPKSLAQYMYMKE